MFTPSHFKITDHAEIYSFIDLNGFGQIISTVQGKILSTHLPFMLSDDKHTLLGHFAKLNPQCNDIHNQEVLVTLQGPHEYVSPSWYLSPGVPTWNYQAVHISGICKVLSDQATVKTIVNSLSNKYEGAFETYWKPEYNEAMLKHIVGFEIEITDIQCTFKLSQNRSDQDRQRVITHLEARGSTALAKAMKTTLD